MKEILTLIMQQISGISTIQYVDEDWGQLDYYSSNMPVKFPCCLIDLHSGEFSNIGREIGKNPINRQKAVFSVKITIAHIKLGNTSLLSPQKQKDNTWTIFDIIEQLHEQLHGFIPKEHCSKMLRSSFSRIIRDDGVQQYEIIYQFEAHNI